MQIHKNELTTGILVIITAVIFTGAIIIIGMPGVLKPLNTYHVYFDNAMGIRPGAPVLLAGREIGKVSKLSSPIPLNQRPPGHLDFEVMIDLQVERKAEIYRTVTVNLTQQGLMGQQVINFVHGEETSGHAKDKTTFVGERIPDISESVSRDIKRLTGPESDLALTIKNVKTLTDTLNQSNIAGVINNTEQLTNTLKREPWRLLWPGTKSYPGDKKQKDH